MIISSLFIEYFNIIGEMYINICYVKNSINLLIY